MTEHEKKQQRAALIVDIEDAQSDLAHLQEKALRVASHLGKIAAKVQKNATLVPSSNDFTAEYELENRLDPSDMAVLSFSEVVKLIEELKLARQAMFNLNHRKSLLAPNSNIFTMSA